MASSIEFVQYVCEQLQGAGVITYKRMFGEFGIYCNDKIIGVVCDNQLFLKPTEAGRRHLPNCPQVPPYEGAKPYLLIECLDHTEQLCTLVQEMFLELPEPKKKKRH